MMANSLTIKDHIDYVEEIIKSNNERKVHLGIALKCKSDIEKVNFFEEYLLYEKFDDGELDGWETNRFCFLEENNLFDDDDLFSEYIDNYIGKSFLDKYTGNDKEFLKLKAENEVYLEKLKIKFQDRYPNGQELIKKYKLSQFSYWFDGKPSTYEASIQLIDAHIENEKQEIEQKRIDPSYKDKRQRLLDGEKPKLKDTTIGGEVKSYCLQNQLKND